MNSSESMDQVALDVIQRYSAMEISDLRRLASEDGHAETLTVRGYSVTVDCMYESADRDAVKVIASVSRPTLLSFMFPHSRATLVEVA